MRIKNPELPFEAYNFLLAEGTEKLHTLLKSYIIQLSNDVCSFSVSTANQKLFAFKCIQLTTLPPSFEDFENTKRPLAFDRLKIQRSAIHFWKAGAFSFPKMCLYFCSIDCSKVITLQRKLPQELQKLSIK